MALSVPLRGSRRESPVAQFLDVRQLTPPHKIMFKKADMRFEEMAADPARRRAAITDFSKRRNIIGICAMVISACAILELWSGGKAAAGGAFAAAVNWSICFKMESDLRLLRAIDRLQKDSNDKPVA